MFVFENGSRSGNVIYKIVFIGIFIKVNNEVRCNSLW